MARPLPSSPVVRHRFLSSFLDGLNRLDRLRVFRVVVGVELGVGKSLQGTDSPAAPPPSNAVFVETLLLSRAMDSSSGCRLSADDRFDRSTDSLNALTTPPQWCAGDAPPDPCTGGDGDEACENVVREPEVAGDCTCWYAWCWCWLTAAYEELHCRPPTGVVVDEDAGVEHRESDDKQLVDADSLCWMIFWQAATVGCVRPGLVRWT